MVLMSRGPRVLAAWEVLSAIRTLVFRLRSEPSRAGASYSRPTDVLSRPASCQVRQWTRGRVRVPDSACLKQHRRPFPSGRATSCGAPGLV